MVLNPGDELGPYEILSPLGAGGMGEVYRARDTRLHRDVALKVLPRAFADDTERRRRFQEEANSLAALNHPNILIVFDVGIAGNIVFLVSELLEGQTLRECLSEMRLSPRRTTRYACEIAQGLAAAHIAGYVHRDLKPENVFITHDDRVKILDFGLAKYVGRVERSCAATAPDSRTVTESVMGSPGYSAPEQLIGASIDHRADIFSFGAILYEMLSGKRAFTGQNSVELMNSTIKEEPAEFSPDVLGVPSALECITRRCLEKKPERRFQCATDLAFALDSISEVQGTTAASELPSPPRLLSNRALMAGLAIMLLVGLGLVYAAYRAFRPSTPLFRQLIFGRGYISSARFTPDGQNVIFGGAFSGRPRELFSTRLDGRAWRSLDLPPADILGISRNGEMGISLGRHNFYQWMVVGTLGEVALSGGAPHPLLDDVCDGDISPDGKEFAIVRCGGNSETLEYPIGKVLFRTNGWISNPRISPSGNVIAFLEHPLLGDDRGYLSVVDTSGAARQLTAERSSIGGCAWSPSGKEVWFSSAYETERQSLRAVTLEGKERVVLATVVDVILQDLDREDNVLLTTVRASTEILVGRKGLNPGHLLDLPQEHARVAGLSYSGTLMAIGSSGPGSGHDYSTLVLNEGDSQPVRLGEGDPSSLSPDGRWVLSLIPSQLNQVVLYPTGTGQPRKLDISPVRMLGVTTSWTSDGSQVLFTGTSGNQPPRAYLLEVESGATRAVTPEDTSDGIISPDGQHVVARGPSRSFMIYPTTEGNAEPVPGLARDEVPIQWNSDSNKVYVWNRTIPAKVYLLDTKSGARTLWLELAPPEVSGLLYGEVIMTPEGRSYAYRYRRVLTDLFLAQGLH